MGGAVIHPIKPRARAWNTMLHPLLPTLLAIFPLCSLYFSHVQLPSISGCTYLRNFAVHISSVWDAPDLSTVGIFSLFKPWHKCHTLALMALYKLVPFFVILHSVIALYFLHSPNHSLKLLSFFPSWLTVFLKYKAANKRAGVSSVLDPKQLQ